jgi:hypothetical protein
VSNFEVVVVVVVVDVVSSCVPVNKLFGGKKSGENRSAELAALEGSGKRYKHACQEAQKAFEKSAKLHAGSVEQGRALQALFDELATQLADCDSGVAGELRQAAEWQSQLTDYLASMAHSVDAFAKRSKAFVERDYADTKKVADAYDKKRLAFNAAEQKCLKLSKAGAPDALKDAERERADAKAAFEAAECDTLAQWQTFGANGSDLIRSCLAAYLKDYATYHKQGHIFFDAKRAAHDGVFSLDSRAAALSPRRQTAPLAATGAATMSSRDLSAAVAANKSLPSPSATPAAAAPAAAAASASASASAPAPASASANASPPPQDDEFDLLDKLTATIDSAEASLATANAPARPRQFAGARPAMPGMDLNAAVARRPSVPGGMNASVPAGAGGGGAAAGAASVPARPTRAVGAAAAPAGAQPRTMYQSLPSAPTKQQGLPASPAARAAAAQPPVTGAAAADALADLDDFLDGGGLEELAPLDDEF